MFAGEVGTKLPEVPPGFTIEVVAQPPEINAPASVAAAPDGRVFIGEDEYNVRCKQSGQGRVKLWVPAADGKGGKMTVFADKTNCPRGMHFADGTLYVVHAPFLTAFRDEDGDGVAEKADILVSGVGHTPETLAPDHSSNGVRLHIDGWLYLAIGDQGMHKATGKDGKEVQLHGGGIVRVRPDGSEIELYVTGLRNFYDLGLDPLFNGFTRDNTNDGDGWNVRLSQIYQGANYGYPRLYKRFSDELMPFIHDFGGGSGTGSMWFQHPAFPEGFNNTLYTCDWGRGTIYRILLTPKGATFDQKQDTFLKGTRPVDMDADGRGAMYLADWGNHSYGKAGNSHGAIFRITNKEAKLEAFPNLEKSTDAELLKYLAGPAEIVRVNAQRVLLRREAKPEMVSALEETVLGGGPMYARVAAMFTLKQMLGVKSHDRLIKYAEKPELREYALRALADRKSQLDNVPSELFSKAFSDADPRVRVAAASAGARLNRPELAAGYIKLLTDPEPSVTHIAMRSLRSMKAVDALVDAIGKGTPETQMAVLRTLRDMHDAKAVSGLTAKLASVKDAQIQPEILKTIARLYFTEAPWDGKWWAIRPDTRGPYFKTATWEESPAIAKVINEALEKGEEPLKRAALDSIGSFQISSPETVGILAKIVESPGPMQADALKALSQMKDAGPAALVPLEKVVLNKTAEMALRSDALGAIERINGDAKAKVLIGLTQKLGDTPELLLASYVALLKAKEAPAKEEAGKAWQDVSSQRQELIIAAAGKSKMEEMGGKLRPFLKDAKPELRKAAANAIGELKDNGSIEALVELAEKETEMGEALRALNRIGTSKLGNDKAKPIAERLVTLSPKIAASKDAAVAKDGLNTVKIFCQHKGIGGDEQKKLIARIAKTDGKAKPANTIGDQTYEDVLAKVVTLTGNKDAGKELFTKLTCVNCHTTATTEKPKGPYLGDVADKYKRAELVQSILKPSLAIAQGYDTYLFKLNSGVIVEGFITLETGEEVETRNLQGETKSIVKSEIKNKVVQKQSSMPEGLLSAMTVADFANLLSFLESLKSGK